METISQDLQQVLGNTTKSDSLLALLGMDVDSSFKNPKSHHIYNDPYHITQGDLQPGQQIQVHIDNDAIHYLHQTVIAGQFVCNKLAYPQNILHCFRCEQVKIGDVTMALNDSTYFVEQDICRTLKPILAKYERGILLKDPEVFEGVNYQSADVFDQPIIPVISATGGVSFEGVAGTAGAYPHAFQTALRGNFLKLSDKGDQWVVNFAFPLHLVAPTLKYLQDAGAVYGGKNQPIQLTLALSPASEALFCINGASSEANFTYTIRNLQLMDVYTVLDPARLELVQRSQMRFPICSYIKYKEPVAAQTVNAVFSMSRHQRAKKLMFGFHWNGQSAKALDAASINSNLCNATAAPFKSPIGYHPCLPISQLILNWGGRQYQLNVQTSINLGLLEVGMMEDDFYFSDHQYRQSYKYVFSLDLQRFAQDDFGSSIDTGQVYVQLMLKTGVRTLNGQTEDWTDVLFQNFKIEFHLVCEEFIDMVSGRYRMG